MNEHIQKIIFAFYIGVLGLFYGAMLAGQLLGFVGGFKPVLAIALALLAGGGAVWAYFRWGGWGFYNTIFHRAPDRPPAIRLLETVFYGAALALIFLLIVLPLARWPNSPVSDTLTWDAGLYHFPKAIDLYRTGSYWDLGIPYGEYPIGYESLLAVGLSLTHNERLFGGLHALIAIFFVLSIWLLACRYTALPPALLLWGSVLLALSGSLPGESNLWWVLYHLIYTIGKNDLLLSAAVLAAVLHAPVGPQWLDNPPHAVGATLTSMIALSVKPNAVFLVVPLWLGMVAYGWRSPAVTAALRAFPWKKLFAAGIGIAPALLWLVRNFAIRGKFFSETANAVGSWSILSNLTNPYLYQYIPRNLLLVVILSTILVGLAVWQRRPSYSIAAVLLILFIKFIATPASAFSGNTQVPAEIAWRFAPDLLAYLFVGWVVAVEAGLYKAYTAMAALRWGRALIVVAGLAVSAAMIGYQRDLLRPAPANKIVLRDQFREKVGSGPYYSAYDYVHQNIRDSVVWVENGLPYYLYGPGYTNAITRSKKAEYTVVFQTAWFGGEEAYPEIITTSEWAGNWTLIYEDSQGKVYQRK